MKNENLYNLLQAHLSQTEVGDLVNLMHIPVKFCSWEEGLVSRAELAQALNMLLFAGIVERVPTAAAYTLELGARGAKVLLDHGALRTVAWPSMGSLPSGEASITRILKPLGYRLNGEYPLDRLKMTGRSYVHQDDPENMSQFFVSELHPERFSLDFQQAVTRVLHDSVDPLSANANDLLQKLEVTAHLRLVDAQFLLGQLRGCFARQHGIISENDYEILLAESDEMAWIATEGNVFNHATDRVPDVFALSAEQIRLGRPMKTAVEISANGRVKQTAFKAASVIRKMVKANGELTERTVPGSFYEFITRDSISVLCDAKGSEPIRHSLDLSFDTGNAQGIFKMTANS